MPSPDPRNSRRISQCSDQVNDECQAAYQGEISIHGFLELVRGCLRQRRWIGSSVPEEENQRNCEKNQSHWQLDNTQDRAEERSTNTIRNDSGIAHTGASKLVKRSSHTKHRPGQTKNGPCH